MAASLAKLVAMKHTFGPRAAGIVLTALCAVLMSCGCATRAMKGTPFYTGEWEERTGVVADRVALWPLVYYRDPALSVLWPFFEKSPDHLALRPVYSVDGLKTGRHVHRVLWPLGEFDTANDEYRFFPFFWGDDYFAAFPLYWHRGRPLSGGNGVDSLFPLWIYARSSSDSAAGPRTVLHLAWPLSRFERGPAGSFNHLLPLFASGEHASGERYFFTLPYGTRTDPQAGEHNEWLLPLYVRNRSPGESSFYSLPYGRRAAADAEMQYAALGLWGRRQEGARHAHWLLPLYAGSGEGEDHAFTLIPPLLSWGTRTPERTEWRVLGPLSRISTGENPRSSYAIPLYYDNPRSGTRLTPLFQRGGTEDSARWHAVAPLYLRWTSAQSSAWVTPLGAVTRREDGSGRTLTPLFFHVEDQPGHSMFGLPPLLSWRVREPDSTDNWLLLGLARFGGGKQPGPSHVLPLFYRDPLEETLLTPLWSQWKAGSADVRAVPPLLSWSRTEADGARGTHLLGGLAGWDTRADGSIARSRVLPLYVADDDNDLLATPLFARWKADGARYAAAPLLLSWRRTDADLTRRLTLLAGLYGQTTNADGVQDSSHLFPLYARERDEYLYTPLFGWDDPDDGDFAYWFTPLIGSYRNQWRGTWVWPLFRHRTNVASGYSRTSFLLWGRRVEDAHGTRTHFFPLFYRAKFARDGGPSGAKGSVLWRLYDMKRERGTADRPHEYVRHRVLWRAWHYERLNGDVSVDSLPFVTYDRTADGLRKFTFMWRFFRYETHPERGTKLDLFFLPLFRSAASAPRVGTSPGAGEVLSARANNLTDGNGL